MSDDLGLDALTDDQLVELARAVAGEIGRRGALVYEAAQAATAAERQRYAGLDEWSKAKRVGLMIAETLGEQWTFSAWRSDRGKRRVYLEGPNRDGRGPTRGMGKITLHVDGSPRFPPGYLELERIPDNVPRDRIAAIAGYIAACWDVRPGIPAARAMAARVVAAPVPPDYQ